MKPFHTISGADVKDGILSAAKSKELKSLRGPLNFDVWPGTPEFSLPQLVRFDQLRTSKKTIVRFDDVTIYGRDGPSLIYDLRAQRPFDSVLRILGGEVTAHALLGGIIQFPQPTFWNRVKSWFPFVGRPVLVIPDGGVLATSDVQGLGRVVLYPGASVLDTQITRMKGAGVQVIELAGRTLAQTGTLSESSALNRSGQSVSALAANELPRTTARRNRSHLQQSRKRFV